MLVRTNQVDSIPRVGVVLFTCSRKSMKKVENNLPLNSSASPEHYRCNLRWSDKRTLLIGWVDTVRICQIRKRSLPEMANRDLPEYVVDPGEYFKLDKSREIDIIRFFFSVFSFYVSSRLLHLRHRAFGKSASLTGLFEGARRDW